MTTKDGLSRRCLQKFVKKHTYVYIYSSHSIMAFPDGIIDSEIFKARKGQAIMKINNDNDIYNVMITR